MQKGIRLVHIKKREMEEKHGVHSPESNKAMQALRKRSLEINGFVWAEMNRQKRFRLPQTIQQIVHSYMRRYDLIEKGRKKYPEKMAKLYDLLQVGSHAPPKLHPDFISLCRNKIDNFIQGKGRSLKKEGAFSQARDKIIWASSTECDGETSPPKEVTSKDLMDQCGQPAIPRIPDELTPTNLR